jgi:hypothetical protein
MCVFQDDLWGCSTRLEFPIVKLIDYEPHWADLEASRNPFAVVVMAHLKTKSTHNKPTERKNWKLQLVTMLYDSLSGGFANEAMGNRLY